MTEISQKLVPTTVMVHVTMTEVSMNVVPTTMFETLIVSIG